MKARGLLLSRTEAEGLLRALDNEAVRLKAGQFYSVPAYEKLIAWLKIEEKRDAPRG